MEQKFGLAHFCNEENLDNLYAQLRNLRNFTSSRRTLTHDELDEIIEEALSTNSLSYYSITMDPVLKDGTLVTKETANYVEFSTGILDENREEINGYLFRPNNQYRDFRFLYWGYHVSDMHPDYKQGDLIFSRKIDANRFFTWLSKRAITEYWGSPTNNNKDLPLPILRSYIVHVLKKIKIDESEKLLYNDKKDAVIFNTNLFDHRFNEIYIAGRIDDKQQIKNPYVVTDIEKLKEKGFDIKKYHIERTVPLVEAPTFYDGVEDIVYQKNWPIRLGDDLIHVVERCKERIESEHYQNLPDSSWASLLKSAIAFAEKVAKSNYKFIVPQYRFVDEADYWEKERGGNRAQLLMPIYLKYDMSQQPDGVLVLDIDKTNKSYCPKTILTLDMVYQNARLIAKPSEEWLSIK